jgi:hypothetical protein
MEPLIAVSDTISDTDNPTTTALPPTPSWREDVTPFKMRKWVLQFLSSGST